MLTLHRPDSVFSLRHVPSWLMLCFAAGSVNAVTFLACGRFVTHVTGTVTRMGIEVVHLTLALDFALVVASFVAGATAAGLLLKGAAVRGRQPPFSQNAAVATSTGQLVRTTHLTGPATDLGVHLADLLVASADERALAKRHAALRTGKILSYGLGAAAAVPACHVLGYLTLLIPAGVIAAATVLSFVSSAAPVAWRHTREVSSAR